MRDFSSLVQRLVISAFSTLFCLELESIKSIINTLHPLQPNTDVCFAQMMHGVALDIVMRACSCGCRVYVMRGHKDVSQGIILESIGAGHGAKCTQPFCIIFYPDKVAYICRSLPLRSKYIWSSALNVYNSPTSSLPTCYFQYRNISDLAL